MLTRNANVSSLTSCEQPEVVEEFRWADGGEGTWAPSAGLSAAGRGHRAGLTGCSLLAAFSGRRKTGSDSSCSPRMQNQPWWVSDWELSDSAYLAAWWLTATAAYIIRELHHLSVNPTRLVGCCWGNSCVRRWRSPGQRSDWSDHPEGNPTWLHHWRLNSTLPHVYCCP